MTAVNKSPNAFSFTSVRLGWQPSVDGQIIVRSPQESLQKGLYAKVRFQVSLPYFACWGSFSDRFRLFLAIAMTRERMWIELINTFLMIDISETACSRYRLPISRTCFCRVSQHPLLITKSVSLRIATTQSSWRTCNPSTWYCLGLPRTVILIPYQLLLWITFSRAAQWSWPGLSR